MQDPFISKAERREMRSAGWYAARWIIAIVVFFTLLSIAIWAGSSLFSYNTANIRGKVSAQNKIKADGEYRIGAYDSFFNECASIQTIEATIRATQNELASKPTAERREELETNITALSAARADAVNQYNADASKSYTEGQFRSSHLPFQISQTIPTEGTTTCAV